LLANEAECAQNRRRHRGDAAEAWSAPPQARQSVASARTQRSADDDALDARIRGYRDRAMNGAAIVPEIVAAFPEQFAAAEALRDFAKANRPEAPPTQDEAGVLILRTYTRSSKTYNASLRLALVGYGAQAGMLNRSLFEDMIVAHWIRRNPDTAPRSPTPLSVKGTSCRFCDLEGAYSLRVEEEEVSNGRFGAHRRVPLRDRLG
jgi:hypothetical protein